jgi:ABC-type transport system substrate-binding protein
MEHPFLENRTFRRALLYAINRKVILEKGLLDGKPLAGCRVLSAPLSAGITANDPAAYAYDEAILPRPYDPVMATILLRLTEHQLAAAADQREEEAPVLEELVLAHPTGELPRFACKQIQAQLAVIGVQVVLRELDPGVSLPDEGFDLLYMELMMREPLSDAGRLFGPDSPIATSNPYVALTLRQLEFAENWKDTRERLQELHRQLYEEAVILPLWQLVDQFVYHRGLQGISNRPISLYEDVERWRIIPPLPED